MPMEKPTVVSVRDARDRAIAVLSDLFAKDDLDVDDFERRVSLVHRAASPAEVDEVLSDLAGAKALVPAPKAKAQVAIVPAGQAPEKQRVVAILGGAQRQGTWTSARHLRVVTVMGGASLDFRDARLPPGLTEVKIFAFMGGVEVIVPPGLPVETTGSAVLGGFEHMERAPVEVDPDQPRLRVDGFVFMGGFSIETRLPGETSGDAHRRRRRERKEERKRLRGRD